MSNINLFNVPHIKILPFTHVIGVVKQKDIITTYCLMQEFNGVKNVLLVKHCFEVDFSDEVANLAKYFNATIIEETN